jgi:DNA-binding HxlR family transcriptional regulator
MMVTNDWEVGTRKLHTYQKESDAMAINKVAPSQQSDPELEALVREIIGRVADKWTMLVLEALEEHGRMRFTRLGEFIGGVSQKMLTKTLRQMEADGLVSRTVFPVIPPRVEYDLTGLGHSLGEAFCGVWIWAEQHREAIEKARMKFRESQASNRDLGHPAFRETLPNGVPGDRK